MVLDEAGRGDPEAAARRLAALDGFTILESTTKASELVDALILDGALPSIAIDDAAHVATPPCTTLITLSHGTVVISTTRKPSR